MKCDRSDADALRVGPLVWEDPHVRLEMRYTYGFSFCCNSGRQFMRRISFLLFAAFASITGGGLAAPPAKVATVEGISEYRFDNGARLLLFPEIGRAHV